MFAALSEASEYTVRHLQQRVNVSPELSTHDAAPHQLPVTQVVELTPLILAVEGDGVLLYGKIKVAFHILKTSSEK